MRARALETWRRLLAAKGPRPKALIRLAEVYADHDLLGEALELYQKANQSAPADEKPDKVPGKKAR